MSRFDKVSREKLIAFYSNIHESGERLLTLIDNLLDISKHEAGRIEYMMQQHDLLQIITQSQRQFSELLKDKSLQLDIIKPKFDTSIEVDHDTIVQVLGNLISNAIKFSPEGKTITISFEESVIQRDSMDSLPAIKISVSDEGIGIPQDELEIIFERFVQSSRTQAGSGGTGLGLAISRDIIEAHGGTLSAMNNPHDGTTISIMLPRNTPKT